MTCTLAVQGQIDGDVFTWPMVGLLTQRPTHPASAHLERHLLLVLDPYRGAVEPAYPVGDAEPDELVILGTSLVTPAVI